MMEALGQMWAAIADYLHDHWIKFVTAGLLMGAGWYLGRRKAARDWRKREFYDRLNVSLTSIDQGTLKIRTLLEKRVDDVFLNTSATQAVIDAARKTSPADSLLPLPSDDYWYYLNSVLNEVSEKFAEGQLARDVGLPVKCHQYLLCLTSEAAGAMRMRKVRAMLVSRRLLEALPETQPHFESPTHLTRWETLQQLAKAWKGSPERFLSLEICLVGTESLAVKS